MDDVIEQIEFSAIRAHVNVLEGRLANLALKLLPYVRVDKRCFFAVTLAVQPLLDTAQTDVAQRAATLARCYQLVLRSFLFAKTDPTNEGLHGVTQFLIREFFGLSWGLVLILILIPLHIEGEVGWIVQSYALIKTNFGTSA